MVDGAKEADVAAWRDTPEFQVCDDHVKFAQICWNAVRTMPSRNNNKFELKAKEHMESIREEQNTAQKKRKADGQPKAIYKAQGAPAPAPAKKSARAKRARK